MARAIARPYGSSNTFRGSNRSSCSSAALLYSVTVNLSVFEEIGANPDQRIHEDARHLTELSTDLGIGLLQSSLLLGSFIGVLWMLSGNVVFQMTFTNVSSSC